jgi:HlyD family secretion protein
VFDTFYRPGEEVPANRPVAALLIPGDVKVRFFVPEEQLAGIALEQPVDLICDGCPQGLEGRVSYISPEAEYTPPVIYSRQTQAKLVFMLEAIPQGDAAARLHPGQPMEVRLKPSRSDS